MKIFNIIIKQTPKTNMINLGKLIKLGKDIQF